MSITMYDVSVPMFRQTLRALSHVLAKAEVFCTEQKLDPAEFLQRRLAPDMFTLLQQVQRSTFHSARAAAELAAVPVPKFTDDEKSFAELQARIATALDFIKGLKPAQFEGSEERDLKIETRVAVLDFKGRDFLVHFAIPQFLFHTTTAYDIIRNAGVEVGKRDFLGSPENR